MDRVRALLALDWDAIDMHRGLAASAAIIAAIVFVAIPSPEATPTPREEREQQEQELLTQAGYWSYRVDSFETPLKRSDRACDEDEAGRARWDNGRVMCYVSSSSREVKVRWTDERTDTYWIADANYRDLARLAVWWRSDRP